ncbi:hypothetical protein [Nocardia puris]|uniref:Uncharacterized protein n=1 Tax=Nocardia puris TaxID=208602 RepID=A0A366DBW9_9NOCA|nr:hypothetical protein [Nocardia puris]RBO87550.1 hypothetical protein DFR74_111257 [Nocardia puris]
MSDPDTTPLPRQAISAIADRVETLMQIYGELALGYPLAESVEDAELVAGWLSVAERAAALVLQLRGGVESPLPQEFPRPGGS